MYNLGSPQKLFSPPGAPSWLRACVHDAKQQVTNFFALFVMGSSVKGKCGRTLRYIKRCSVKHPVACVFLMPKCRKKREKRCSWPNRTYDF